MAVIPQMSWIKGRKGWMKQVSIKGTVRNFAVSCKQLGMPGTKEESVKAANDWWTNKQAELAQEAQTAEAIADQIAGSLATLGELAEAKAELASLMSGTAPAPTRRNGKGIAEHVASFLSLMESQVSIGDLSKERVRVARIFLAHFTSWLGTDEVKAITSERIEGFWRFCSSKVADGTWSKATAHSVFAQAKTFIRRLEGIIPMPGALLDRRLSFKLKAKPIPTFTLDEIKTLFGAAPDKAKLWMLLGLNCGMTQRDMSDLLQTEVDWEAGTITRKRSKHQNRTSERIPTVTYKLWPTTLTLLKALRCEGEYVLCGKKGRRLVDDKTDHTYFAWLRLTEATGIEKPLKVFRKTSATLLGENDNFARFATYFLANAPEGITEMHYGKPSQERFFAALDWLREQYGF